jgi:transposase-like protein
METYWNLEKTQTLHQLFNNGDSIEEIASILERSTHSVRIKLAKEGLLKSTPITKRIPKETLALSIKSIVGPLPNILKLNYSELETLLSVLEKKTESLV